MTYTPERTTQEDQIVAGLSQPQKLLGFVLLHYGLDPDSGINVGLTTEEIRLRESDIKADGAVTLHSLQNLGMIERGSRVHASRGFGFVNDAINGNRYRINTTYVPAFTKERQKFLTRIQSANTPEGKVLRLAFEEQIIGYIIACANRNTGWPAQALQFLSPTFLEQNGLQATKVLMTLVSKGIVERGRVVDNNFVPDPQGTFFRTVEAYHSALSSLLSHSE